MKINVVGGTLASWLVRATLEGAVRVRALVRGIVLCSWATHFTLTVPLFAQVYKWAPANCWGDMTNCAEVNCERTSIPSRGSRNTSSRFMLPKPGLAPAATSQFWLQGFTLLHLCIVHCNLYNCTFSLFF